MNRRGFFTSLIGLAVGVAASTRIKAAPIMLNESAYSIRLSELHDALYPPAFVVTGGGGGGPWKPL